MRYELYTWERLRGAISSKQDPGISLFFTVEKYERIEKSILVEINL